jgi:lipid A 3-O-deacylase
MGAAINGSPVLSQMRAAFFILPILLFCMGLPVHAQATIEQDADRPAARGVWSLTSENDLFGGTDRDYTNGIRIERVSPEDRVLPILDWAARRVPLLDLERRKLRQGLALSHAIFTPNDISLRTPDPDDRPYAGWLYVSGTVVASDENIQDVLQLNLGVVGPAALGEFVQTNWHDLIEEDKPKGWGHQLRDEPGVELIAQRMALYEGPRLPLGLETDYGMHAGGAVGNVRTYAATGLTGRIGWDLGADFGPPRIRPALAGAGTFSPQQAVGGYLFAGLEGRFILRDMFLDGNAWRDSPRVSDRNKLVADAQAGAAIHVENVQLAFTYVHRTEEFQRQAGPQRFGAVSISVAY